MGILTSACGQSDTGSVQGAEAGSGSELEAGSESEATSASEAGSESGTADAGAAYDSTAVDAAGAFDSSASSMVESGMESAVADTGSGAWWIPAKNTTFYWDLAGAPPDNTKAVGAYDIDGWNNTASEVMMLHAQGMKVVCYMDVGSYEPSRPDSNAFPASLKGQPVQGWPGEFWLDVRPSGPNHSILQSILLARFKVCQSKGFDAVEPDNMDSYQNTPGFPTSAADQIAFNEWVAQTVHGLGMAVFQKNDLAQIPTLVTYFDGILDEQCNQYAECATLAPYTAANKPVWNAEYMGGTTFCNADVNAGIVGALFALNLDGSVFQPCSNDIGRIH
ncbi:MAG: endo alpha-1,4 polygalactosaminidase [Myxococcota bacterium]|nr:endo alpha-1,4 polygalactosaminidase [Myxococcota bacterium]